MNGTHPEGDRDVLVAAAEETQQIPCQHSRTASLSSLWVSCPWPGLPRSARFVSCKRAKDHGRSEALRSQTAGTQLASTYQGWIMDYLQPHAFTHQPPNKDLPSTFWSPVACQVTGGQQADSDVAAIGA